MVAQVKAVESLKTYDHYDWIVVQVRKNQVDEALPSIRENLHTPNVLVMVNNPFGYRKWIEVVGKERLIVGFPGAGGTLENGVVKYTLAPSLLQPTTLGEVDGQITVRLQRMVRIFKQAGFPTATCPNKDDV